MAVDYAYYSKAYGGGLTETAFSARVGQDEAHVKWLCEFRFKCYNACFVLDDGAQRLMVYD
ncbi:MAG: hypothetical protein IKG22_11975 [Atopobiaceae bacterium]|nr:hypothetical protein [Atopobiaceae bacterium]